MYADSVERKQKESASVRWLRHRRRASSTGATKHPSCRQPFLQVATYIILPWSLVEVVIRSGSLRLAHGFDSLSDSLSRCEVYKPLRVQSIVPSVFSYRSACQTHANLIEIFAEVDSIHHTVTYID